MMHSTAACLMHSIASFLMSPSRASSADPPSNKGVTPIVTKWTDDHQLASSSSNGFGWNVYQHLKEETKPMSAVPETAHDSMTFWGPFIMDQEDTNKSLDNYFIRRFQCESDTSSIVVEYHTAICGATSIHSAASRGITELWMDWDGDVNYQGAPIISEPVDGYPYPPLSPLADQGLESICLAHWAHSHRARWIPQINEEQSGFLPARQPFRTVIKVQGGAADDQQIFLFGITVECVHEVSVEAYWSHWTWKRVIGVLMGGLMIFGTMYSTYKACMSYEVSTNQRGMTEMVDGFEFVPKEVELQEVAMENGVVFEPEPWTFMESPPQSPEVSKVSKHTVLRRRSSASQQP